ncbi:hypothetical protein TNCV_2950071 [Trichonephila clavipes]|nr:hypothetical protein TNCV_2950071 [Trichonephila clavipes]
MERGLRKCTNRAASLRMKKYLSTFQATPELHVNSTRLCDSNGYFDNLTDPLFQQIVEHEAAKSSGSWLVCPKFVPSTTEDPPMHVKSVERSCVVVVWQLGVSAQVSSSSLDHGSK